MCKTNIFYHNINEKYIYNQKKKTTDVLNKEKSKTSNNNDLIQQKEEIKHLKKGYGRTNYYQSQRYLN